MELNTDYTDTNSQTTTKDDEKANIFVSSVFTTEQPGFIPTMSTVNNKTEMDKLTITENTILSILKEVNISKSPGLKK